MTTSKIRLIELDLIKSDVSFYIDLVFNLILMKSVNIFIFGLIPYLSLFTVETYKYIQSAFPSYAASLSREHQGIVTASRMRTKFFDDTEKRIDGIFELLNWIIEFNEERHINQHKGLLGPLKRALQDDLTIFFYDGHIIGSTHTGFFNIGYEKTDLPIASSEISKILGPLSKSVGEALGAYLGQLCNYPEFSSNNLESIFSYSIQDEKLKYKDEKSKNYFNAILNHSNEPVDLKFSLLLFLTTINFLKYIFTNLVTATPPTVFKLKFITLYHLSSSLEKLQNYYYPTNTLTDDSKNFFGNILNDSDLKLIRSQKKFRNILVHYTITEIPESMLNSSTSLYGLVEFFFGGRTYNDLDSMLDNQIERISVLLEEWLNWKIMPRQLRSR